jgi:ABC-2 type transport system permease protein
VEFARDTVLILRRQMSLSLRHPAWIVVGLSQPILYLALFGPLLGHIVSAPGSPPGDAWQIFVPGLLVQLGLFGVAFVGFTVISDSRSGVLERMRVTPVSRLSLLLGRVLRDVIVLLVQSTTLILAAVVLGLRAPLGGILFGLGLLGLLAISLASLSYATGLVTKSEETFAPLLNFVTVPLLLLSGILLPMSFAPQWLDTISRLTPLRYVVEAIRDVFLGHYTTGAVLQGTAVAIALAAASLAWGRHTFLKENS